MIKYNEIYNLPTEEERRDFIYLYSRQQEKRKEKTLFNKFIKEFVDGHECEMSIFIPFAYGGFIELFNKIYKSSYFCDILENEGYEAFENGEGIVVFI